MIYLIYLERLNPSRTSSLTSSATPNSPPLSGTEPCVVLDSSRQ